MTTATQESADAWISEYLSANRERHLAQMSDLIRIPSVSALSEHRTDMRRAAQLVAEILRRSGAPEVTVHSTEGNPIVMGGWPRPREDAPLILVYAHYDTQPADPIERWLSDPFNPAIRDNCIFGRGASDNKGTLLIPIIACEALTARSGRPAAGIMFIIEGEEEIGSPHLRPFIEGHRDVLNADAVLSADSVMWTNEKPSIVRGCRGLLNVDIALRSASTDLHSGLFGGMVPNAAVALTHLLASMVSPTGEVTIDEFHSDVAEPSVRDRALAAAVEFDVSAALAAHGVDDGWSEREFEPVIRNWYRPTLDFNGLHSGFSGDGPKTIIPSEARAKVSCRLVPHQTPERAFAAIQAHVRRHTPPEIEARVERAKGGAAAFTIDPDDRVLNIAAQALADVYGHPPLEIWLGATLPFATLVDEALGLKTVMLGWGMPDENAHAPNEFFRLENLDRGVRVYARLFTMLSAMGRASR